MTDGLTGHFDMSIRHVWYVTSTMLSCWIISTVAFDMSIVIHSLINMSKMTCQLLSMIHHMAKLDTSSVCSLFYFKLFNGGKEKCLW